MAKNTAGAALAAALDAELTEGLEWDAREQKLIETAADLADRLAEVKSTLDRDGVTSLTTTGTVRAHPLLAEQRQLSVALAKVLESVRLPDETGQGRSITSLRKSRAAHVRWDREAAAREARSG
ncbi:hypothetical protein ACFP6A_05985 [Quadrisphaera sp. GCM10027208]|uniref:hypothetical protein n=1 Tax=Quadrisphaera sp. GCM10027208 TaxID=3273423 RepID=UPI00360DC595